MTTKNFEEFFMLDVPTALRKLSEDSEAQWGSMSPQKMLNHLRKSVELSLDPDPRREIITPAEKLTAMLAFLRSEKDLPQGSPMPEVFNSLPDSQKSLMELKVSLMKQLVVMWVFFENNPEHESNHPNFGRLRVDDWLIMHRKHFEHHLRQFQLL